MPNPPHTTGSRLQEVALAAYAAALVYASLYPWNGWRTIALSGWAFLTEPWPRYWTWFDLITNVLVYMPLGLLLAGWLKKRFSHGLTLLLAIVLAAMLSVILEGLQTFLPGRVPSRLDWLTNVAGAALGGSLMLTFQPIRHPGREVAWHRPALIRPQSSILLIVLFAWVVAQVYPQRLLFGVGDVVHPLFDSLRSQADLISVEPALAPVSAQLAAALVPLVEGLLGLSDYALIIEALAVACAVVAVGLLVVEISVPWAPRAWMIAAVIVAGLAMKVLATWWLLDSSESIWWLSPGAQGGLVVGVIALGLVASSDARARMWLLLGSLVLCWLLTNVFPVNAYYESMQSEWELGAWRNFLGFLRGLSMIWPPVALAVLLLRLYPVRRRRSL